MSPVSQPNEGANTTSSASGGKPSPTNAEEPSNPAQKTKLYGRDFYRSLGSPKMVLAPMVDRSEFVRSIVFFKPGLI